MSKTTACFELRNLSQYSEGMVSFLSRIRCIGIRACAVRGERNRIRSRSPHRLPQLLSSLAGLLLDEPLPPASAVPTMLAPWASPLPLLADSHSHGGFLSWWAEAEVLSAKPPVRTLRSGSTHPRSGGQRGLDLTCRSCSRTSGLLARDTYLAAPEYSIRRTSPIEGQTARSIAISTPPPPRTPSRPRSGRA